MVEPRGARANSWEDVADLSARAGIVLDEWQETILRAAMGERADATWTAKRVGVTVPRQNGKSQLLVSRALAGALLFGEKKIVVSAHQQDTAREAFAKLIEILESDGNGWLMDRVKPNGIMNAINRESVKFKNGATIQFKARSGAGGKGFSSDCLMLDEAQILSQRAWTSINSTMSAMPNPQVWLLGTSPQEEDDSEVFESVRSAAIDGKSTSAAWCEWGTDAESPEYLAAKADLAARRWSPAVEYVCWVSNPAWNTRMNLEVVMGECETYTPEKFAQDRLGLWSKNADSASRAISAEQWSDSGVESKPEGVKSFGVAFSLDGDRVSLGGAVKHANGVHVELMDAIAGPVEAGLGSLADWLAERWRETAVIVVSGSAHAGVLAKLLTDRGVPAGMVQVLTTGQYLQACAMTLEAVRGRTLTHLAAEGQAVLDASVAVCDTDKRGGFVTTVPDGDETPLEAVSVALWAARTTKRKPRGAEKRKAVIV